MKGEPVREQHDLHWHDRNRSPRNFPMERHQRSREDIASRGAALFEYCFARPCHMWLIHGVANHFECEVGFDTGTDVWWAAEEKRPATLCALRATKIDRELALQFMINGLTTEMAHQNIFGAYAAISFELEPPMPILPPEREDGTFRAINAALQWVETGVAGRCDRAVANIRYGNSHVA